MRIAMWLSVGVLAGCGSTVPKPQAPVVAAAKAVAVSEAPNPCVANPCGATIIDPAINPCAGEAAVRGAGEAAQ